jgi:glycosyltransferase involved in cell wall biosynthesis
MKVVQILYSGIGGHGTVVKSLINADLRKENTYDLIFTGVVPLADDYMAYCKEKALNYKYVSFQSRRILKTYLSMIKSIHNFKPDVIYLHSISFILPVALFAFFTNTKVIAIEHQTNSFKKRTEWIYSRLLLWLSDKIVYLSDNYKKEIIDKFSIHSPSKLEKLHVIGNGIDMDYLIPFQKKASLSPQKTYHVCYTCRLIPLKDFDTFISVAEILISNEPEIWQFTLAGDGPEMERIKKIISEKNLSDKIKLTGFIEQEKIAFLLADCDIYLHTSKHENMSTAILQAMAQKVPVVASDIPGNRVIIENNVTGILCKPGDVQSFKDACELLAKDIPFRNAMIDASENAVRLNFSHLKMFQEYHQLAKELIGHK